MIKSLLKKLTVTIFAPDRKFTLISFRTIITLLLLFFILHAPKESLDSQGRYANFFSWGISVVLLQFLSNLWAVFVPQRILNKWLVVSLFFFDIVSISLVIYWTQGFQNDLFLTYFLVVFMSVIARKPSVSFLVAGVSCLLYGFFFFQFHSFGDFMQSSVLIRFSLLLVVAFLSSTIVQDLEAQEDVIYKMSHELRNSISSILVASKLLLQESQGAKNSSDRKTEAKMASIIARTATRMGEMIEDILELFRYEMGKVVLRKVPVAISDLIQECMDEFSIPCEERGLTLLSDVHPHLPLLDADPVKLRQALLNLVGNALKFTPVGGTITVGASLGRAGASVFNGKPEISKVEIFVKDTGAGMNPEQLKRIFEKFYQVNGALPQGKLGLGLGLAIVKAIVDAHHGSISVKSAAGKGTLFSIALPLESPVALTAPERLLSSGNETPRTQEMGYLVKEKFNVQF